MIRNETFANGMCVRAEIIDVHAGTVTVEEHGTVVDGPRPLTPQERQQYARQPLDPTGALATLLAVQQVVTVSDAANAVGLTPDDLVHEAQAWAVAAG